MLFPTAQILSIHLIGQSSAKAQAQVQIKFKF